MLMSFSVVERLSQDFQCCSVFHFNDNDNENINLYVLLLVDRTFYLTIIMNERLRYENKSRVLK